VRSDKGTVWRNNIHFQGKEIQFKMGRRIGMLNQQEKFFTHISELSQLLRELVRVKQT